MKEHVHGRWPHRNKGLVRNVGHWSGIILVVAERIVPFCELVGGNGLVATFTSWSTSSKTGCTLQENHARDYKSDRPVHCGLRLMELWQMRRGETCAEQVSEEC